MKNVRVINSIVFLMLCLSGLHAQESSVTTGGEATGPEGTVSYSIGLLMYTADTGGNGSVTHGIQHAYDNSPLNIGETKWNVPLVVYPNPVSDVLNIKVENTTESSSYQLFDIRGIILESNPVTTSLTTINTGRLPKATYLLKVVLDYKQVNVFKIIGRVNTILKHPL